MAQGKKNGGGKTAQKGQSGSSEKKAKSEAAEESSAKKTAEAVEAKEAAHEHDHDDHAKAAAGHGPAHAAGHHAPNRKEYMYVFLALAVLTVIEVGVAQVPGISKTLMAVALVGLAVSKAAIVGLYYMHLKHETKVMRLTVAIPMATPAVYALVLITEGAWRLAR